MKKELALQKMSDAELLKMIADVNSSDALETLMLRYHEDIENIGYGFLRRRVLRQDLHQDVFETVLRMLKNGSYKENGRFDKLVHTIAYFIARDTSREERHLRYREEDYEFAVEFIADDAGKEKEFDFTIMLNYLSRGQRKVMEKRLLEHKSFKEIAGELHMTENGVRSVCSKAVQKLQQKKKELVATAEYRAKSR